MGIEKPLHILIAPLDWGLGHTTRCVPIIRYLLQLGHKVSVAGNEWQRSYIAESFPGIATIHLQGYNVHYARRRSGFSATILRQVPGIIKTIRKEREWLLKKQEQYHFDAIISDNRYGLQHPSLPSVILTHQAGIQTGMGHIADALIRRIHYKLLNKFTRCWLVDTGTAPGLSGKLSRPGKLPANATYIGLLSQFDRTEKAINNDGPLLVLLSGPEPQRSILSDILWAQVQQYPGRVVFTEGNSEAASRENIPAHITYYKRLNGRALLPLLQTAQTVICRSGYSTIMDLVALQKKAILIPTPGQTEQEYLARYLQELKLFPYTTQENLNLTEALKKTSDTNPQHLSFAKAFDLHKTAIIDFINNCVYNQIIDRQ